MRSRSIHAEQAHVDQQQIDGRVAHSLADADGGAVQAVGAGRCRRQRVDHRQAAILVPVPVDLHLLAGGRHHLADEAHQVGGAGGGGVADGVGDAHPPRAGLDRLGVEAPQVVGLGAGGVLGDEHHRQPLADGELHRLAGEAQHAVEVPRLGVLADGAGADEAGGLDRQAGRLRDVGDRLRRRRSSCARRSWARWGASARRSPAPAARRRRPRAARRRAGRGRPTRCRGRPSGGACSSFSSIDGDRTDGDCRPSRRVSSSSSTTGRAGSRSSPAARFQS